MEHEYIMAMLDELVGSHGMLWLNMSIDIVGRTS